MNAKNRTYLTQILMRKLYHSKNDLEDSFVDTV